LRSELEQRKDAGFSLVNCYRRKRIKFLIRKARPREVKEHQWKKKSLFMEELGWISLILKILEKQKYQQGFS
jgi:hypothetical protein